MKKLNLFVTYLGIVFTSGASLTTPQSTLAGQAKK
jgi:hypothetical protein